MTSPLFDDVSATDRDGYQENVHDPTRPYTPVKWVGAIDKSVTHTRHVLFLKPGYALLLDTPDGTGRHTLDAHLHLDAASATVGVAASASTH